MTLLVVLVEKVGTPRQTLEFHQSPVRIGRGPGNDVHLPLAFVSDVHAEVEFDELGARYIDLGSTNGSFITGRRVPSRVPIAIEVSLAVEIGALRLTIARSKEALLPEGPAAAQSLSLSLSPPTIFPHAAGAVGADPPSAIAGELHAPTPQPVAEELAPTGPGQGETALALCRAFIRLRRVYERCGREMGVRPFLRSRGSLLHGLDEPVELLHALNAGAAGREELEAMVGDMAGHHDALLAAITAGARAALARTVGGRGAARAGAELDGDGAFEAALFGPAFAEAYASGRTRSSGD
jgi:hypothetical protein